MPKRRKSLSSNMPRSGNVIHVSQVQLLDLAWVKKFGLEDVDWDPATCCPECIAERAERGEIVEELDPPSGTRVRSSVVLDVERAAPAARGRRASRKRSGERPQLKLVRSRTPDEKA